VWLLLRAARLTKATTLLKYRHYSDFCAPPLLLGNESAALLCSAQPGLGNYSVAIRQNESAFFGATAKSPKLQFAPQKKAREEKIAIPSVRRPESQNPRTYKQSHQQTAATLFFSAATNTSG
jgi:hypothetical protein